jgi:probable rRNA maturation factor
VPRPPEFRAEIVKAVAAPFEPARLRSVLSSAAALPELAARLPGAAVLVVRVTGDRELRRLNRSFLGEDHPTDVLAFPAGDGEAGADGHLGDLAISWPAVRRQALEHGHAEFAELALLAVHGLLHVLGWDHATRPQEREMTRLTRAALARAGLELAPGRL